MQDAFDQKIYDIQKIKCMVLTKQGKNYGCEAAIFNIRGTRIYLIITKTQMPFAYFSQNPMLNVDPTNSYDMTWRCKVKNKKEYNNIPFEEVLDHKLISDAAKTEIVFNLNVFLS